jgi:NAD(P)-dependent dehydrogenase (short-subunit alcohol dehydrogenase family)
LWRSGLQFRNLLRSFRGAHTIKLKDKRVLVVGGGSGIGYAVAEACIAEGANVSIASSNLQRVRDAAARLGAGTSAGRIDVTQEADVAAYFAEALPFDHIVTTAGDWGGPRGSELSELDLDAARRVFDVRFWGALLLAKHGAKKLAPGGSLTFTDGMRRRWQRGRASLGLSIQLARDICATIRDSACVMRVGWHGHAAQSPQTLSLHRQRPRCYQ